MVVVVAADSSQVVPSGSCSASQKIPAGLKRIVGGRSRRATCNPFHFEDSEAMHGYKLCEPAWFVDLMPRLV